MIHGADGSIDLGDPQINAHRFARLDLSAADATSLVLDDDAVSRLAPNTAVVRVIAAEGDLLEVRRAPEWRLTDPITIGTEFFVTATHQQGDPAVIEANMPHPWKNFLRPSDINNDGVVTALDALVIINELARNLYIDATTRELLGPLEVTAWPGIYFDQNGDDRATALDALRVINRLGVLPPSSAESEQGELMPVSHLPIVAPHRLEQPTVPAVPEDLTQSSATGRWISTGREEVRVAVSGIQRLPAEYVEIAIATDGVDELLADEAFLQSLL